ncbi:hypothetical protein LJC74_10245 [Eubacteriales bacterium OttesenSCG-928-A19]|nr:hypothetical protein [Eubacteriales bacterium OttesenSCG-928-A19]
MCSEYNLRKREYTCNRWSFGKWGAGKSTLVNLVKGELASNDNAIVIDTNAWLYEGYADAKTSLMETMRVPHPS